MTYLRTLKLLSLEYSEKIKTANRVSDLTTGKPCGAWLKHRAYRSRTGTCPPRLAGVRQNAIKLHSRQKESNSPAYFYMKLYTFIRLMRTKPAIPTTSPSLFRCQSCLISVFPMSATTKYIILPIATLVYLLYTLRYTLGFKHNKIYEGRIRVFHLIMFWLVPFVWIWLIKELSKPTKGSHEIENKVDPISFGGYDNF